MNLQVKGKLTAWATAILSTRGFHSPATVADFYKPGSMPTNLRAVHEAGDEILERIYIGRRFRNDTEWLKELFAMYGEMSDGGETALGKRGSE